MHQFFVPEVGKIGARIRIAGEEAHHLVNVLRLETGDLVAIADSSGKRFLAALEEMTREEVTAYLERELPSGEPPLKLTLLQGVAKGDKFDFIIQKTTELGISAIIPVQAQRSVAKIKPERAAKRLQRWQRIAKEAAKQCGRARVPEIEEPATLERALQSLPGDTSIMIPWEDEKTVSIGEALRKHDFSRNIALVIGPEGGLTAEEVALAVSFGAIPVSLGQRILRTETAAIAAVAIVMYQLGDLGGQACG
ncbi:MAG: 16S rRNA (uracil(1498)-N(3))-methyltransferase [Thermoanaerobacteraceae bacterium]|nr:16S rRNA (uracil(1498)-N(3))-methyltransferase [Thermoanaerobacteraceae bacterium]